jgi:Rieske Fe-S protein
VSAGFFALWAKVSSTSMQMNQNKVLELPFPKNRKVTFTPKAIIVNENGQTKVFSSHCTHLGCVISSVKDGQLICPCHGSRFSLNGEPLKGPAIKPLKPLDFEIVGEKIRIKA